MQKQLSRASNVIAYRGSRGHAPYFNELPEPVPVQPPITILMGERARSIEHALRIAEGKYPVYCQWHGFSGPNESIDTIESPAWLRRMYAVPSRWEKGQWLTIRRA